MIDNIKQYIIDGGEDKEMFNNFAKLETTSTEDLCDLFRVALYNGNIAATCYYFKKSDKRGRGRYTTHNFDFCGTITQGYMIGNVDESLIQKFVDEKLYCGHFLEERFLGTLCDHQDYNLLNYLIDTFDHFEMTDVRKLIHDDQTELVKRIIGCAKNCFYKRNMFELVYETGNVYFKNMLVKLQFPVSILLLEQICKNKDTEFINYYRQRGKNTCIINHSNINYLAQYVEETQFFEILEIVEFNIWLNFENKSFAKLAAMLSPLELVKFMEKIGTHHYDYKVFRKLTPNLVNNLVIYDDQYTRLIDEILCKKTSKNNMFIQNNKSVVDKYIDSTIFSPSTFNGMCSKRQTTVLHLMMFCKHLSVGLNQIIPKPIIWIIINNMFLINYT